MKSFNYIIQDELGLHARPSGLLAKEAWTAEYCVTEKYPDCLFIQTVRIFLVQDGYCSN